MTVNPPTVALRCHEEMRLALLPHGSRGDVQPMIALGEALRARGHQVLLAGPPDAGAAARAAGLEFAAVGRDVEAHIRTHGGDFTAGALRGARAIHGLLLEEARAQFDRLPALLAGIDLAIGAGLQVAAASVCEALGIAYRYVVYCPALLASRRHTPMLSPLPRMPGWANQLGWWLVRGFYGATLGPVIDRERRRLGLGRIRDVYDHVMTGRPILATDPELAPVPADCRPRPQQVGYLHRGPARDGRLPAALEAFLAAGPAPVYIGFGSMGCADPARVTRTLVGALRRAGRRGIIARGWAGLGDACSEDDIAVVDAVDHGLLFPRLAAAVHHGGAGTTAAAARAGIPQVIVPHIVDQYFWAERVRACGVGGAPVPRAALDEGRLGHAIRAATDGGVVSARARALGDRLRGRRATDDAVRALRA